MILHCFCSCFTGTILHLKDTSGAVLVFHVLRRNAEQGRLAAENLGQTGRALATSAALQINTSSRTLITAAFIAATNSCVLACSLYARESPIGRVTQLIPVQCRVWFCLGSVWGRASVCIHTYCRVSDSSSPAQAHLKP